MVYDVYGLESMDFLKETQTFKKYLVLYKTYYFRNPYEKVPAFRELF